MLCFLGHPNKKQLNLCFNAPGSLGYLKTPLRRFVMEEVKRLVSRRLTFAPRAFPFLQELGMNLQAAAVIQCDFGVLPTAELLCFYWKAWVKKGPHILKILISISMRFLPCCSLRDCTRFKTSCSSLARFPFRGAAEWVAAECRHHLPAHQMPGLGVREELLMES